MRPLPVKPSHLADFVHDLLPQGLRRYHLHVGAELQDLHLDFAEISHRQGQLEAAVGLFDEALVGVPLLVFYPAGAEGAEAQGDRDGAGPLEETEAVLQEFPDKIFRVNLPPGPYAFKDTMQLETDIDRLLKSLRNYNNIIIGTGILPPEVPAGNIQVARKCILSFYN